MKTITKATARKAYERADKSGECADWEAAARVCWAFINKPKAVRRRRGACVWPPPSMHVSFADGRRFRASVYQKLGAPLPRPMQSNGRAICTARMWAASRPKLSCATR